MSLLTKLQVPFTPSFPVSYQEAKGPGGNPRSQRRCQTNAQKKEHCHCQVDTSPQRSPQINNSCLFCLPITTAQTQGIVSFVYSNENCIGH